MKVPLLDLAPYHRRIRDRVIDALARVVDSGAFVTGAEVERFESELAERVGAAHAVGVSNGSDALVCALSALGVGAGHEVITTPFSFFATVSAVLRVGARPCFVDIEADGFGLDPALLEREATNNVAAVIAVHLFGAACAIERVAQWCEATGVPLVEDAAQALGATCQGRSLGTWGRAGCYSFFPAKLLGALGDAGAVVTHDAALASRVRRLRSHGAEQKHHHLELGGNYRLDELQAAVLRLKLRDLGQRVSANQRHARYYEDAFHDVPQLVTPRTLAGGEATFTPYTLRVLEERDRLQAALAQRGIATAVHYPMPLHLQPALQKLDYARGDFPVAERRVKEVLSIPLFPEMTHEQRDHVVREIRLFFG